jgi:MYXO-CTERM domain-containing protein
MRSFLSPLVVAGLACSITSVASATVLTFDFGGVNTDTVPSNYGSHVSSFAPGLFNYGPDGGITPNVSVVYSPVLRLGGASPSLPTRVFGDLDHSQGGAGGVLYRDNNGGLSTGILQITLAADPGYLVCLDYFDLAAVFNSVTGVGEDLPARSIQVLDGSSGAPLYQLDYDPANPPSTYIPGTQPLRHRRFDWSANPLTASSLIIRLDLTQLITIGGSKVDRIGIDNIKFTQVPSPAPAALLTGAVGMLAARRRRR